MSRGLTVKKPTCVVILMLVATLVSGLTIAGCDSNTTSIGDQTSADHRDCLPDLTLTDQNGRAISLASLKGKAVLFDFIYTTCPGPCLVLTTRMKAIADELGPALGSSAWFVSVTVDPEHDSPAALRAYAKEQGADRAGWLFLAGTPADVDRVMAQFELKRSRSADGTVDHVLEFFLVGADGRPLLQYLASDVNPAKVAGDVREVIAGRRLADRR
jgi:protein SCO1/2